MKTELTIMRPGGSVDHLEVDLPQEPGFVALREVLTPLLDGGDLEHVTVLHWDRRADMFVDEVGKLKGLDRNEAATAIYRANWMEQHPEVDPQTLDAIYGPAVLFNRIVWT
jgi:hypothetical protein